MNANTSSLSVSVQLFPRQEGVERLSKGSARIKFGVDPTSPNLHLGHAVPLLQLRKLQDAGHTVVLVIGNFTAAIGDPTGRNSTRPALSSDEIDNNAKTYLEQAFLILDRDATEVVFNRDWLGKMSAADLIVLASKATVAQMSQRKDFAKRLADQTPVSLHEFLYPLLQGHDSVHLRPDAEIGGTDQTFNLMMGRGLMADDGQTPQFVMTTSLLVGLDGEKKMSKSYGNDVGLMDAPVEKFSKIMTLPDRLIAEWGDLLTNTPQEAWAERMAGRNPRDIKFDLAKQVIALIDGDAQAKAASNAWTDAVLNRKASDDLPIETIACEGHSMTLLDVLVKSGLTPSKTVARQKVQEQGVRLDGVKLIDPNQAFSRGNMGLLQVGKKHFKRVLIA